MKAQGVFNALASGFGVSADNAALMSRNLTQLAYDISSFYNIDVDDAIKKVQSGFAGQIRPVRDLGYDLSQARLEAVALANGIDKEVKSMTQGEKSQLRYIALMTQLTEVQGDLARTIDSPTNQLRVLNAQLEQMYRSIGLVLLPLLNKIIPYLNALFRVIKMIAEEVAALFGYTLPTIANEDWSKNVSLGAEDLEDDLEDATGAAQELKNTLASFDQINLITSSSGGSGSGNGSDMSSGFDLDLPSYDFLGEASANKAQAIADEWMKKLRPFIEYLKDSILWTYQHLDDIKNLIEIIAVVSIGRKLWEKGKAIYDAVKEMKDWVKGTILVTVGFQLSYIGGKTFGGADSAVEKLKGALEGIVGAAAAAYGGYLIAGVPGLAVGLALSVSFFIKGMDDAAAEQAKQRLLDTFFAFKEGRQDVESFNQEWEKFVEQYSNPELREKLNISKELEEDTIQIGRSIDALRKSYKSGEMDAESYVGDIDKVFGQLEEKIKLHTEAAAESIRTALSGELGDFLRMSGLSVQKADEILTEAQGNIDKAIEDIRQQLDALNQQLVEGMDTNEYDRQFNELIEQLKQYYNVTQMGKGASEEFAETFSTTGINFTGYKEFIETIGNVQTKYHDMVGSLHDERDELIKNMESFLPGLTGAHKAEWQRYIDETKNYYDLQEQELTDAYYNVLNRMEGTAFENWDDMFNTDGFFRATEVLGDGMTSLSQAFEKAYTDENLKRPVTAFKDATILMNDVRDKLKEGSVDAIDLATNTGVISKHYNNLFATISSGYDKSTMTYKRVGENTKSTNALIMSGLASMVSAAKTDWDRYSYYVAINTDKVNSKLPEIPKSMQNNLLATTGLLDNSQTSFYSKSAALVGQVALAMSDKTGSIKKSLKDTTAIASGELVSRDLQERYRANASILLGAMSNALVDPEGKIKKAIKSSFSGGESEMETIGKGLGLGIAKGMDSVNSDAENSVSKLTKRMGKPFNQFGSDLYTYMNTMTAGIVAIWNSIEISTGKATLSSKLKVPKWAMQGYASGGFPNSADFFYANENGVPEYVGTMGGKTAVANNQEITKGVSDAVYKAIKETGIANDVKKIANKNGNVVFAPSEQAGRVIQQSVNMYNQTGGRY